jgi:intracellular sulfur oxidation DsrE/DsrF family protein
LRRKWKFWKERNPILVKITLDSDVPSALENAKNLLEKDGWKESVNNVFINKNVKSQKEARERLDALKLLLSSILTITIEVCYGKSV